LRRYVKAHVGIMAEKERLKLEELKTMRAGA
jgi:hypothetical protein